MKTEKRIFYILILLLISFFSSLHFIRAQSTIYTSHGWQLQDYRTDSVFGAGINRAYAELLKGKKAHPVVVAVIDMGVDTAHEDLVGHIWTNSKEIPGNGIDDDHNGYVDDIHGWNFLGGKNGKNIDIDSYESYREYYRLKYELSGKSSISNSDRLYLEKVRNFFLKDSQQWAKTVLLLSQVIPQMRTADSILQINLHKD